MLVRKALTQDRAEHVDMVIQEHGAAVRSADARREQRMASILAALEIPAGVAVQFAKDGEGFALTYEGPDISPTTDTDGLGEVSVKSTAPVSAGDS